MHILEQAHPYWKTMSGFSRILFPTDFSTSAAHALENALCLAGVREVIVQHVVSTYFEKHPHWSTLFDIHEMQKRMDMYIDAERAKAPRRAQEDIHYRSVISEGQPARQIVELAEREKVDAIVMGPATGVVTSHVIRASTRPVLAIPPSDNLLRPLQQVSKILVATDFSPYSKAVVDYAFQLKPMLDCEMFLLNVIADPKMSTSAKNQLDNLTPAPYIKDRSVHPLVEEGPVSNKILECADAYDVNLIVLGAHGYGPVERHFVGTTMEKVLTKVSRPLLVVRI